MSTKVSIVLASAIVLNSAIAASAQAPPYYDYGPIGRGGGRSLGLPPPLSDNPAATGGGSAGYNENLRRDDW